MGSKEYSLMGRRNIIKAILKYHKNITEGCTEQEALVKAGLVLISRFSRSSKVPTLQTTLVVELIHIDSGEVDQSSMVLPNHVLANPKQLEPFIKVCRDIMRQGILGEPMTVISEEIEEAQEAAIQDAVERIGKALSREECVGIYNAWKGKPGADRITDACKSRVNALNVAEKRYEDEYNNAKSDIERTIVETNITFDKDMAEDRKRELMARLRAAAGRAKTPAGRRGVRMDIEHNIKSGELSREEGESIMKDLE